MVQHLATASNKLQANDPASAKSEVDAFAREWTDVEGEVKVRSGQVYTDTDPRAYPLSSYSYMIIPKDTTSNFNTEKGRTLSEFAYYFLCEGQQQADALGYSPLRWSTLKGLFG